MKYLFFILFMTAVLDQISAQVLRTVVKGRSETKHISYRVNASHVNTYAPPNLRIERITLYDDNGNHILERNEKGNIELQIKNEGKGTARDVYIETNLLSEDIHGLIYSKEFPVGSIYPGNSRNVVIPIKAHPYINSGMAHFRLETRERFGYVTEPAEVKIGTHNYVYPELAIKNVRFATDHGGEIRFNYPIYLQLTIENAGPKPVHDIDVNIEFENPGCVLLDDNNLKISALGSYEEVTKDVVFTVKQSYSYDHIPINVRFKDAYDMFADTKTINLDLNQFATNRRSPFEYASSFKPDVLISDIDVNIPFDSVQYPHRYALIIGNEDYTRYQPMLSSESNVIYARNDAITFKKYTLQTLGIPEENIFMLLDGTYAEMLREIERVSKIIEKLGTQSELIFYYAGHGFPHENTRTPYLIPVDVSAHELQSAIKLSDIYQKFGQTGAERVTFFIDACFTGGGRESGLMAARAFTIEPKYETLKGNIVVFNSSSGTQASLPYHDKKHGIFTYYLLKKLQETNGYISYGELSDYLTHHVSLEALRVNSKEQDPKVNVSAEVKEKWEEWVLKNSTVD